MCIIIPEILEVERTKIIVSKLINNQQLVVYSNKVKADNSVAMILPFPNKFNEPFIIETTSSDVAAFKDIDDCFPMSKSFSLGNVSYSNNSISTNTLKVYRSGNYRYSIAHNLNELQRTDPNVFQLNNSIIPVLSDYESRNFGFLVCIIDRNAEYSPFAYICSVNDDGRLFIPTKHYHEKNGVIDNSKYADDWDHMIYVLNTDAVYKGDYILKPYTNLNISNSYSFSKYLGLDKYNCPRDKFHRIFKRGRFLNEDILV